MTRAEKIFLFGSLYGQYGGFSPRQLRVNLTYRNLGRGYRQMIEGFDGERVHVVTYYGNRAVRSEYVYYNTLPDNIIDEILYLYQMWESVRTGRGRWDGNRWRYGRYENNRWRDGRWYGGRWHGGRWDGGRWHDDDDDRHGGGHGGHDDDGHGGGHDGGHDGPGHPCRGFGHPGQGGGWGQGEGGGQGHDDADPRDN